MKRIWIITRRVFIFLLLIKGMSLSGQNEINFSYKCENEIKRPFKSRVFLKRPENKTYKLFSDTIDTYNFSIKNFFKTKGKYTISILFEAEKNGKDSIDYDFELNGNEVNTVVSVSFDYRERGAKKGEKIINGYIRINKYYDAPKSIDIEYDKENLGDEYNKGPFFRIKNNSNDTIYGEYLSGYFWGKLSFVRNDSILATRIGSICYEFVGSPPLYPDSTKIATVGSFGLGGKLIPFDYKFEVMLAKKWQSQGIGVFEERKNCIWWGGTKEYFKLKYNFKIDETMNR